MPTKYVLRAYQPTATKAIASTDEHREHPDEHAERAPPAAPRLHRRRVRGVVVGNGRRGGDFVVGDLDRLHDDRGDVVLAAGCVRGVDEELRRRVRVVLPAEDAGDLVGAHHRREAVRAEEDAVAGPELDRVLVDLDLGVDAERTRDDRTSGVHLGLLACELAVADHLLDQAVIVGDLRELTVADEVCPRIADVPDDQVPVAPEHARGERGAHAGELLVGHGLLEDGVVGALDRVAQGLTRRDGGSQRFERRGARDLAGAVTAHAVGDGDQAEAVGLVEEVVLVAVANPADVGDTGGDELEGSPAAPPCPFAALVTSATVWPNCTRSPRSRRVTPLICLPFT